MFVSSLGEDWMYLDFEGNEGDVWEEEEAFPAELTVSELSEQGWTLRGGLMILDNVVDGNKFRLAWDPRALKFYIGYGELPHPVRYIHEVQHILRDCGFVELANSFKA